MALLAAELISHYKQNHQCDSENEAKDKNWNRWSWKLPNLMFKCQNWSQISSKTELPLENEKWGLFGSRLAGSRVLWGRGREEIREGKREEETTERREIWADELEKKKKRVCISLLDVLFFPWSISFCGSEVGGRRGQHGRGGGQRSWLCRCVCVCVVACRPVISCCQVTALSLDAWRRSGVSCCPGTPAERRPAPTPGSHRPPSLSDLDRRHRPG